MNTRAAQRAFDLLSLLLLLAAVALFYPRVGLPGWSSPGGDVANLFLPAREWAQRWLAQGIVPLWNPQIFGGVPFAGAMQAAVFYPPHLLLGAFLSPLATINVLRLAHIFLFGALTWHFLRAERNLARPAALLGALAVAGSAHVAAHTDHVNQLAAMAWLPGLVTCQWRWFRTGRSGALLAFSALLALQLLAGHPQAVFYTLLLSGAVAAFWILDFRFWIWDSKEGHPQISQMAQIEAPSESEEYPESTSPLSPQSESPHLESKIAFPESARSAKSADDAFPQSAIQNPRPTIVRMAWMVTAIVGGFALAGIQMLPTAETSRLSRRAADDLEYALFGSMPARFLETLVAPRAFGNPLAGYTDRQFGAECGSYVGRMTLVLALAAIGCGIVRRRPYAFFWLAIIALALVLALGGYGPFWGPGQPSPLYRAWLWLVPPARHLRVPPRILLLATFGLAVLGAEGLDCLMRLRGWERTAALRRVRAAAAWCAVTVLAFELWMFQLGEYHHRVVRYYPPDVMLGRDVREALAPVLAADNGANPAGATPSPAGFRIFRLLGMDDPDYLMDPSPGAVRSRYVRLQPNLGMLLGVADLEGYEEGLLPPLRYFDFLNFFNRNLRSPDPDAVLLGLMNVRYLYADARQPIQSATWKAAGEVLDPGSGRRYRLYENPLWLPRVVWADWLPPEIALGRLRGTFSRGGPLSTRRNEPQSYGLPLDSVLQRGRIVAPEKLAELPVLSVQPNCITVGNPARRGGTLLVAQNAYPGWVVEAGGASVALRPATDFSGSAVVPLGAREIKIVYRPFSFRTGAYASGVALAIWLAALIILLPSRPPHPYHPSADGFAAVNRGRGA